jgi:hypothetical protein
MAVTLCSFTVAGIVTSVSVPVYLIIVAFPLSSSVYVKYPSVYSLLSASAEAEQKWY